MQDRKISIITGGSSGIGMALARAFGKRGFGVFITGRNEERLRQAVELLRSERLTVEACTADVSVEADSMRMFEVCMAAFGRVDVLINNAGISMRARFEEVNMAVVRRVMDVNFYGALYATRACLPEIIRNKGSIVGISSIAGYRGLPERVGYSASKFALNGFLEALRTEMLDRGVHVLTAAPGFTASNIRCRALTKDGREQAESPRDERAMMSAETCAEYIVKAVLKRKNILILTTQGKLAVWINRLFPSLADRLVKREMDKEHQAAKGDA